MTTSSSLLGIFWVFFSLRFKSLSFLFLFYTTTKETSFKAPFFTNFTVYLYIKMLFRVALFAVLSTAATLSNGFVPRQVSMARGGSFNMSTEAKDKVDEGKKAGEDAPPVNIGWDSHKAVVSIDLFGAFSQKLGLKIYFINFTKRKIFLFKQNQNLMKLICTLVYNIISLSLFQFSMVICILWL